jgi:tetratricopeptide (TPR) repeat protein
VTPAAAEEQGGIDRAIALYNDLEYSQAAALLEATLNGKARLTVAEKSEGYKYLGLANVVLGKYVAAKHAFRKLLEINPSYRLSRTENSQALDLFAEVLNTVPAAKALSAAADSIVVTTSPVPARPGRSLTVLIETGDAAASRAEVLYRDRPSGPYSRVAASAGKAGRFEVSIPGTFIKGPTVQYHVRVLDGSGAVSASYGTAKRPVVIDVSDAEEAVASRPLYRRWWFWATLTAVAAGSAVAYTQLSGDPGNNDAILDLAIEPD